MGNWKELTKDFNIHVTDQSVTAVRSFIWDTNSTVEVTLPKLGDKMPSTLSEGVDQGLYVKGMTKTLGGGHPDISMWVMEYNTLAPTNNETSLDDLMKTIAIGGEMLNIGNGKKSGTKWTGTTDLVDQDVFKRVVTNTIKVPMIVLSLNSIATKIINSAGKVNSDTWNGWPQDYLLFNGVDSTEFRNDKGQRRWRVEFNIEARVPTWQKLCNETTGAWTATSPLIYERTSFASLLIGVSL